MLHVTSMFAMFATINNHILIGLLYRQLRIQTVCNGGTLGKYLIVRWFVDWV